MKTPWKNALISLVAAFSFFATAQASDLAGINLSDEILAELTQEAKQELVEFPVLEGGCWVPIRVYGGGIRYIYVTDC